ncbi:hypothetical protein [Mycoplasmopsis opalescens]|uniref:hypothetical protein n=1 Tax=Mycoplasmopsis opalescens TaxID=114886 RepID=UPI0004A771AA|nr:hypothetical protein [Mycoplasmopsis opalescens]
MIDKVLSAGPGGEVLNDTKDVVSNAAKWIYNIALGLTWFIVVLFIVIALALLTKALIGKLHGKVVNGERQKMANGKFIRLVITATILIIIAIVIAILMYTKVLNEGGLLDSLLEKFGLKK